MTLLAHERGDIRDISVDAIHRPIPWIPWNVDSVERWLARARRGTLENMTRLGGWDKRHQVTWDNLARAWKEDIWGHCQKYPRARARMRERTLEDIPEQRTRFWYQIR